MQASQLPSKIALPFANSGTKNTIPTASQIGVTAGAASLTDGFPPLTFTPLASGGVPPSGADFNGILNMITAVQQWQCAGGIFKYDATFSTSIGGYPKGATLCSTSNDGSWLNLADNNTSNPDAVDGSAANWFPVDGGGITQVTGLTNANVTLTPAQFGKSIVSLSGALTGNVQIVFPSLPGAQWLVVNSTTGNFAVTVKMAADTGLVIPQGARIPVYCSSSNTMAPVAAYGITPPQFDNSSLFATMAALVRSGWAAGVANGVAGGTVLTAAYSGKICLLNAAPGTVTLPASAALPADRAGVIAFWGGVNGYTLNRAGTDLIYMSNSSTVTSVALNAGDTLYLVSDGGTGWIAFGGSAQLQYSTATLGRLIGVQTWSAAGTFTYTPTAGMKTAVAEGVGGGGAGGGTPATNATQITGSNGGGSGAYAKGRFTAAQIGASQAVTIGAAGVPVAAGTGTNGGTTSLGALMSMPGGVGGIGSTLAGNSQAYLNSPAPSNGASTPSGGNILGLPGAPSGPVGVTPGGNGFGGMGGASQFGPGGFGANFASGGTAIGPGGGGGGTSVGVSAPAMSGGFGGVGMLIIWEYA